MNTDTISLIILGATKIVSEFIRYRPLKTVFVPPPESSVRITAEGPRQETIGRGVSTADTIAYQKRELEKQISLLEIHLTQGCKIEVNGVPKACDCCEKHPKVIQGLAEETLGMTGDPIYKEIITWVQNLAPLTTADASASGKYDSKYPDFAAEGRRLRKSLMGTIVDKTSVMKSTIVKLNSLAHQVTSGEITREQAVARVKEMAQLYDKN